jgi:hypothetical protein
MMMTGGKNGADAQIEQAYQCSKAPFHW